MRNDCRVMWMYSQHIKLVALFCFCSNFVFLLVSWDWCADCTYLKWLHDKNNSSTEWINESWSENWRFFKWIFLNLSQYNFSMLSNCMRVQRHYHWIPTMTYLRSQPLPNNEKVDSMEMASITLNGCSSNTRIET